MLQVRDERFSADEWQSLLDGVLRVYFGVARIDGHIDVRERSVLFDIMADAEFDSPAFRGLLHYLEYEFPSVFADYLQTERSLRQSITEIRAILHGRLDDQEAAAFADDLVKLAELVASASSSHVFDDENVSAPEAGLLESIAEALRTA